MQVGDAIDVVQPCLPLVIAEVVCLCARGGFTVDITWADGALREAVGPAWGFVGGLGVLTGFVILSYYIVVAGWAMDFTLKSVVNITEPIHDRAEPGLNRRRSATAGRHLTGPGLCDERPPEAPRHPRDGRRSH